MTATSNPNVVSGGRSGLAAGFAGTTAMATTTLLQRLLAGWTGPVDYDDSHVAVDLVERWTPLALSGTTERVANQVLRFGYGASAGLTRHLMEGRVRHPGLALFASTWGGEVVMLRILGLAPPPWRWPRRLLLTSLAQHAIYAAATDRAYRRIRDGRQRPVEHLRRNEDGHDTTT